MAQQLKQKTEDHDKEIMEVKYVAIATVVKDTVKKAKIKARKQKKTIVEKDDLPINEYLAHRQAKIRRNEAHMNSLGLGSSSSRLRKTSLRKPIAPKMKPPNRKTPISSTPMTKKVLQKGRGNPSLKSKRNISMIKIWKQKVKLVVRTLINNLLQGIKQRMTSNIGRTMQSYLESHAWVAKRKLFTKKKRIV